MASLDAPVVHYRSLRSFAFVFCFVSLSGWPLMSMALQITLPADGGQLLGSLGTKVVATTLHPSV